MKSRSKKPGKKEFNPILIISNFVRKQKEKNNQRLTMGNRSSQEVLLNKRQFNSVVNSVKVLSKMKVLPSTKWDRRKYNISI